MAPMSLKRGFLLTVGFTILLSGSKAQAIDLKCYNQIGGSWSFGTAPSGCNVSPSASVSVLSAEFKPVIFLDKHSNTQGRRDYLSEMFPVVRDVGTYYIKRRKPSVSDAEVAGFLAGLYALAAQETVWTHYRLGSDGILRYMRGDSLHGHGLMQVDDRSHVAALKQGKGVDLVYNILYGLDIYYAAWNQAATSRCVSSASNYHDRARAAWAAYNGGPGAICRWQANGTSDKSYNSHYTGKAWLAYVADPRATSKLNVRCLAEGTRPCAIAGAAASGPAPAAATPATVDLSSSSGRSNSQKSYVLAPGQSYKVLRACASTSCGRSGAILHGRGKDIVVFTGNESGEWSEVQLVNRKGRGWVQSKFLVGS